MAILHKQLTVEEALEYIAYAVWQKDLPNDFDGDLTCEMNEDGSVEVYAIHTENDDEPQDYN